MGGECFSADRLVHAQTVREEQASRFQTFPADDETAAVSEQEADFRGSNLSGEGDRVPAADAAVPHGPGVRHGMATTGCRLAAPVGGIHVCRKCWARHSGPVGPVHWTRHRGPRTEQVERRVRPVRLPRSRS